MIRRENARMLADSVGGVTCFARKLNKPQSQISHVIGKNPVKNIGDKMASEIEAVFDKPSGWLDKVHSSIEAAQELYTGPQKDSWRFY